MDKLKDLLHELRCDIAAIPENEENKIEIENAQETLRKAWTELLRLYNVVGRSEQLIAFSKWKEEKGYSPIYDHKGLVDEYLKSN